MYIGYITLGTEMKENSTKQLLNFVLLENQVLMTAFLIGPSLKYSPSQSLIQFTQN